VSTIFAFEVTVAGKPDWWRVINATTRGQAKKEYHRHLQDPWPDIPFTLLRCRKLGPPQTSPEFRRTAEYRGIPNSKCGDRVRVGEGVGYIVGHNSSANFDVLFDKDSPKYAGLRLNVHPQSIEP